MGGKKVAAWLSNLVARLRHHRTDADLREELQTHLEMHEEDDLGAGMSVEQARRRARLALGSPQTVVENVRDQEVLTMLESCWRDFQLGLRALRKNPVFCLTAVLTLGIGIGANTAVFTLLYGLLLRSLPAPQPQRLAYIGMLRTNGPRPGPSIPYRMFDHLRSRQRSFAALSAWAVGGVTMEDQEGAIRLYYTGLVSGNAFDLLELKPHLGRLLTPADDVRGGPAEGWPVVLSYGFWKDRFGCRGSSRSCCCCVASTSAA